MITRSVVTLAGVANRTRLSIYRRQLQMLLAAGMKVPFDLFNQTGWLHRVPHSINQSMYSVYNYNKSDRFPVQERSLDCLAARYQGPHPIQRTIRHHHQSRPWGKGSRSTPLCSLSSRYEQVPPLKCRTGTRVTPSPWRSYHPQMTGLAGHPFRGAATRAGTRHKAKVNRQ